MKGELNLPILDPTIYTLWRYLTFVKVKFATFLESDGQTACAFNSLRRNSTQLLGIFVSKFMDVLSAAVDKYPGTSWLRGTQSSFLALIEEAANAGRQLTGTHQDIEAWFR